MHHPNGKTGFATIPASEMQFTHPQSRKPRPPDPILAQDIQIMKVLHVDNKHDDNNLRCGSGDELTNGGGRRRSSANTNGSRANQPQPPQHQQAPRPHPHARSKDISKQNIIAHQKQGQQVPIGKKSNLSSSSSNKPQGGKDENVVQYYPSYNPHNPNVAVRPPDSPEQFGWAYGVNSCDSNHCSNCILNTPGHNTNHPPVKASSFNSNTNSLNR